MKILEELNPLSKIKFIFFDKNKHLVFKFRRVFKAKTISHLLVTVRDITTQVELAEKLVQTEK